MTPVGITSTGTTIPAFRERRRLSPEFLEPRRTQLGVSDRVHNVLMAQIGLQGRVRRGPRLLAGLLDLHEGPYSFAMVGPMVNHFHCVWIDE